MVTTGGLCLRLKFSRFERHGIPKNWHPRQVYYGAVGKTRRSLAFKLPIAVEDDRVVLIDGCRPLQAKGHS